VLVVEGFGLDEGFQLGEGGLVVCGKRTWRYGYGGSHLNIDIKRRGLNIKLLLFFNTHTTHPALTLTSIHHYILKHRSIHAASTTH
jgi:hypothetical protein